MKKPLALIVDDSEMDRQILNYALKKLDFDVIVTRDAQEFLLKLKTEQPDCCFIDLQFNGVEMGFRLIQSIRAAKGANINLFIVSGVSDRAAIAHAIEIGANDYFTKPLNLNVLGSKLARYVRTDRIEDFETKLLDIDDEQRAAEIAVEFDIVEVDEFGVKLDGPHLLSKGSVVRLQSQLIAQATGKSDGPLVTVTQTWVDDVNGRAGAYAEFDVLDGDLLRAVRQWLSVDSSAG